MTNRKEILETIKKCLALGDKTRNPSEHEAETALRMAQKLMAEHNLTMADVAFSEANFGAIREEGLTPRSGVPRWETRLANICDNLFGTKHYLKDVEAPKKFDRGGYSNHVFKRQVVFYGYDTDVALSVEVYKLLKLEILSLARRFELKESASFPELTPGHLRAHRFAYCDGVVYNLTQRSKQEAPAPAKVKDLVVRKDSNINDWARKNHPDLHPVRQRGVSLSDDATRAGLADGAKLSLNFKSAVNSQTSTLQLGHKK